MESILFLGFTLNAWIVIVTVLLVFILMLCTKLQEDLGVFTHPVSDDSAFLAERHTVCKPVSWPPLP